MVSSGASVGNGNVGVSLLAGLLNRLMVCIKLVSYGMQHRLPFYNGLK